MLTGRGCNALPESAGVDGVVARDGGRARGTPLGVADARLAAARLRRDFAFVGLTDHWDASVSSCSLRQLLLAPAPTRDGYSGVARDAQPSCDDALTSVRRSVCLFHAMFGGTFSVANVSRRSLASPAIVVVRRCVFVLSSSSSFCHRHRRSSSSRSSGALERRAAAAAAAGALAAGMVRSLCADADRCAVVRPPPPPRARASCVQMLKNYRGNDHHAIAEERAAKWGARHGGLGGTLLPPSEWADELDELVYAEVIAGTRRGGSGGATRRDGGARPHAAGGGVTQR